MAKLYYGCDEVPEGWRRYHQRCNLLEVESGGPRAPTIKTLNRWRASSPKGFCFVLQAEPEVGEALDGAADAGERTLREEARAGWEVTQERARALAAKAIVLQTGPELTPGADGRAQLEAFAEMTASCSRARIWEPSGLWTPEAAREIARELGLIATIDPFLAEREGIAPSPPGGDLAFVLTERGGVRRHFDQFDMDELIGWTARNDRAFVMLRGRFKWQHARELQLALRYNDDSPLA